MMEQQVLKYDWISFDIFDTLIKRCVPHPTDLFTLIEKKYNALHTQYPIENFKKLRVKAENEARAKSLSEEIQITDIYHNIALPKEVKQELIRMEIDAEYDICKPNEVVTKVFNACAQKKKNIIITSDMYLPNGTIIAILEKCGIKGYKKLYLSSQARKSKVSGNLFKLIINENHLKPKQIIHIGDSLKSDYLRPLSLGMHAILIRQKKSKTQFDGKALLGSIINVQKKASYDYYQKFGYECFGPLLWGYTHWLIKNLKEREIKKVYFLSRDGYIIQKAFELVNSDSDIENHYLEVSRRSLRVPILWMDSSFEALLSMLSISEKISLQSFFDCIGLDMDKYRELITENHLNKDSFFYRKNIRNNINLTNLYRHLQNDIKKNSQTEFSLLQTYLHQMRVEGEFAIVDIGWSGGMQRFLQKTLNKIGVENHITGFYTGVAPFYIRNMKDEKLNLNGYLFDYSHHYKEDERSPFVGLYETLFLEGRGSVKCYRKISDNLITAERYPYEYKTNNNEYLIIKKIQDEALKFIKDIESMEIIKYFNFSSDDLFSNLKKVGLNPSWKDIKKLGSIHFFDEGEVTTLGGDHLLSFYLLHPKQLKKDLLSNRWKTAFLKKMLVLPLPYYKIYKGLKKYQK